MASGADGELPSVLGCRPEREGRAAKSAIRSS